MYIVTLVTKGACRCEQCCFFYQENTPSKILAFDLFKILLAAGHPDFLTDTEANVTRNLQ